jgi:hypothetical protein
MTMKTCTKCLITKERACFSAGTGYRDGKHSWCKACVSIVGAKWRLENKEILIARAREWSRKNIERRREVRRNWQKKHRPLRTPAEILQDNIRAKVWAQLKGQKRGRSTFALLGYSPEDLRKHLESLFRPGMTWENYGEWHMDHRKPKALFDVKSPDDPALKECWALSNLQPLWATENCSKQDRRID